MSNIATQTLSMEIDDGYLVSAKVNDTSLLPTGMSLLVAEPGARVRATHLQISQIAHEGNVTMDNIRIEVLR